MIAIKGMTMPESCYECPIMDEEYCYCRLFELRAGEDCCCDFTRPETCPLIEAGAME